jgi:dynein heavy chain
LASFLIEAPCSSIKLQKNYRPANFRDDFKVALLDSGCKRRPNVFLLADTQIVHEQFLEDVNSILNTGEIADLYEKDDLDTMAESLEKYMREQRIPPSSDNIYQTFIK